MQIIQCDIETKAGITFTFAKHTLKHMLTCCFVFITCFSFSQQSKIDSLLSLLKTDKPDTSKVQHLNALAWEISYRNLDTAIILSSEALQLATEITTKIKTKWNNAAIKQATQTGMGQSYNQMGAFHYYKGDFSLALQFYQKALDVWERMEKTANMETGKYRKDIKKLQASIKNKKAAILGNIGIVYSQQGDYPKALDYYFKALKIAEELGNKQVQANALGNIGSVYANQKDYPKALDYYSKALKIAEELNNKNNIAAWLSNIGSVYDEQKDYSIALDYYYKALTMGEELGDKNIIATNLGNIGASYCEQKDYPKALDYFFKALKMGEALGAKSGITTWLGNIGELYTLTKKYAEAEKYLLKSLSIANEIGSLEDIRAGNKNLSELYTQTGNYKKALEYYQKAMAAKDSLFNTEKHKEITRMEMNFEYEKKEATAKAEQEKKDLKKDIITGFSIIGLMLMLAFLLFAFRSLRVTTKQTFLIISNFLKLLLSRPRIFRNKDTKEY